MANKKKEVFRPGPMTEGKRNIIQGLLQEFLRQKAFTVLKGSFSSLAIAA